VVAVRRLLEPLRDLALEALRAHQAPHALLTDGFAVLPQVFPQAGPPIAMVTGGMKRAQLRPQDEITLAPGRERATESGVEPAPSHAQTATQDRHRMPGLRRSLGGYRQLAFAPGAERC
jgi:hypothetical protein